MPPPTTRRSNALDSSRLTSRGCMVELLLYSKDLVPSSGSSSIADVRTYWNHHIHDLEITTHAVGTPGFFSDLDQYHFEKLHHLLRLVDFNGWRGKRVLEVGCGAGTDLARFARGGAIVTGVDLAASAIELARKNFEQQGLQGEFREADGEHLPFDDNTYDLVYAHGVVQYTPDGERLVEECRRVLKPGGRLYIVDFGKTDHPRSIVGKMHRHALHKADDLAELATNAGLQVVESKPADKWDLQYVLATA